MPTPETTETLPPAEEKVDLVSGRVVRTCTILLTLLGVFYTLYFARALILPLILATLLSLLLAPAVRFLRSALRIPTALGAGVVLMTLVGVLALAVVFAIQPASDWVQAIPSRIPDLKSQFEALRGPFAQIAEASEQVEEMASGNTDGETQVVKVQTPSWSGFLMEQTPVFLANVTFMFILLYFLLASGDTFLRKIVRLSPRFEDKRRTVEIAHEIEHRISRYLGAITIVNLGLGVVIGASAWFLGFGNAILWGVLAFVLNYVPYVGALIGALASLVIGLLTFAEPTQALALPAIYVLANVIEGNLITPMVVSRFLTLNPVVVFISIMFWAWLWNVPGALLAVPILAVIKIVCDHVDGLNGIGAFIGGEGSEENASTS
ncbi:MAG: AI-2E family transporter [Chthoniobacterales bacterium]